MNLDKLITSFFNTYFSTEVKSDSIPLGESIGCEDDYQEFAELISKWTYYIDVVLEKLKNQATHAGFSLSPKISNLLLKERGVSLEEYLEIHYTEIEVNSAIKYIGFKHFQIFDERIRKQFIHKYTPDAEGYVQALLKTNLNVLSFFLGGRLKAYLPLSKLKMHSYVVAPTGSGKSELLRVLFYELQKKYEKFSFVLIDPHGDLAKQVKRFHLNADSKRVIYIDPFLKEGYFPTFNVFDVGSDSIKDLTHTASQIIKSFEEVLCREGGEFSEIMVSMLEKCIYFLLERKNSNFLDLANLLDAKEDILREAFEYNEFFGEKFVKTDKRSRDSLHSRLDRLLTSPSLRQLVSGESTFNLEKALNSGKVIIFNLGELDEMSQAAFGKFLVANIKSLVRKRDPETATPTFVFIDECQNLVSGSFEYMLSQLRKFGLHLVLANQYVNQLGDQIESVKKNTAVKIIGGDDPEDIKAMVTLAKDKISLKDYEYYLKMRGRTMLKIKSPAYLINNPDFEMTKEEESAFDAYQISKYYKVVGQTKTERIPRKEGDPASPPSNQSNKPPFDLFLGHDGDSTDK